MNHGFQSESFADRDLRASGGLEGEGGDQS